MYKLLNVDSENSAASDVTGKIKHILDVVQIIFLEPANKFSARFASFLIWSEKSDRKGDYCRLTITVPPVHPSS